MDVFMFVNLVQGFRSWPHWHLEQTELPAAEGCPVRGAMCCARRAVLCAASLALTR